MNIFKKGSNKNRFKMENIVNFMQKRAIIIGFFIVIIILAFTTKNFFTINNFLLVIKQTSAIGITTIAMGIVIIMGCIDLSVGSVMAVSGIFGSLMVSESNPEWLAFGSSFGIDPTWIAVIAALLMGAAFGAFNGIIVAKGKIPPFIVTLGSMTIARGLAFILSSGMPVAALSESFTNVGGGKLSLSATDPTFNINYTVFFFIAIIILASFIMSKRRFGRYIYAIGGNETAALAAGINVDLVKIKAYILSGIFVGLAGMLSVSRLKTAPPAFGNAYELDAIAGCIIGGISFNGGIGTILAAVIGALILTIIKQGMDMLDVQTFYQQIVKGLIIILAVLMDRKRAV